MNEFYRAVQKSTIEWFYLHHKRDLPWRQSFPPADELERNTGATARLRNPYHVWVCEVMSQQTQIGTIISYFERWISLFPTVAALAEATEDSVKAAWAGLGYYRRALYLKRGAEYVMRHFGGKLPAKAVELQQIPGIGPYTAAAVSSICFGENIAAVDGNVVRVITRLRCERDVDPKATKTMRAVTQWTQELMNEGPCEDPGAFNEGLMEIGSGVCKPSGRPLCEECPLQQFCKSYAAKAGGEMETIEGIVPLRSVAPKKKKQIVVSVIHEFRYGDIKEGMMLRRFVVVQRPEEGLLGGMLEFPSITYSLSHEIVSVEEEVVLNMRERLAAKHGAVRYVGNVRHIFSHIDMEVLIYYALWKSPKPYRGKDNGGAKAEETGCCIKEEAVRASLAEELSVAPSRIFVKTMEEIRSSSASRLLLKVLQRLLAADQDGDNAGSLSTRKRVRRKEEGKRQLTNNSFI
ncbi:putative endonuclease III [Trypanosoma conorhini]|uniref:Adenine DNA glycosylase n=1 Tax=Trypanosoma conorhini TaxID=83891 RepID=A0A3R7PC75_9TRYP|nr:putative endonuclease III [Trypanosoma conorhini]RNF16300.1 putative endonuclease III [Trypanosoma conorhini]